MMSHTAHADAPAGMSAKVNYHDNLQAIYDLSVATPYSYTADEIDKYGVSALRLKGDERIYALWRVLYAYKNDQDEADLIKWRDRIFTVAHREHDDNLDQLARFMYQVYQNETHAFNIISNDDWATYSATSDKALRNIVTSEKVRYYQHFRQWADAVDLGDSLIIQLRAEGRPAEGLLEVTHQVMTYVVADIGDYDAYYKHQVAIARLSADNAFFSQKMDTLYDMAFEAARENDMVMAVKFQTLHADYVHKYKVVDLITWDEFLCAHIQDEAQNYRAVVNCLKTSNIINGPITTNLDASKLRILTKAYAMLYDVPQGQRYLAKLKAVSPSLAPPEPAFEKMVNAYLLRAQGKNVEAFDQLGDWSRMMQSHNDTARIKAVRGMYLALRKELDRKDAESRNLAKQVEMGQLLFAAAALIVILMSVITIGGALYVKRTRKMQLHLTAAHEHAEAANEAKSRFLAVMSHELRTPLNGVLGMAQALQKQELRPQQKDQIGILVDSGKTLMSLLNDVLDMSRIEAGKIELAPSPSSLKQMIERVIHTCGSLSAGKPVTLSYTVMDEAAHAMSFDVLRVYQCLSNIVANALKFTEKGAVTIIASAEKRTDPDLGTHNYLVRIEVRDTGIGMSKATLDKLFVAFSQADAMTTHKYGGAGLGLNISRNLAELMGGALSVTSEEGMGSSFIMTFVAADARPTADMLIEMPEPVEEAAPARTVAGKKILLVDDHPVNRRVVRLFLEPFDFVITEAVDGQEALDADMSQFDLVLMDLNMPKLGGLDACKIFRAQEKPGRHVPIVALSADAMKDQIDACYAAGMDAHIAKPILMDALIETVGRMLELSESHGVEEVTAAQ